LETSVASVAQWKSAQIANLGGPLCRALSDQDFRNDLAIIRRVRPDLVANMTDTLVSPSPRTRNVPPRLWRTGTDLVWLKPLFEAIKNDFRRSFEKDGAAEALIFRHSKGLKPDIGFENYPGIAYKIKNQIPVFSAGTESFRMGRGEESHLTLTVEKSPPFFGSGDELRGACANAWDIVYRLDCPLTNGLRQEITHRGWDLRCDSWCSWVIAVYVLALHDIPELGVQVDRFAIDLHSDPLREFRYATEERRTKLLNRFPWRVARHDVVRNVQEASINFLTMLSRLVFEGMAKSPVLYHSDAPSLASLVSLGNHEQGGELPQLVVETAELGEAETSAASPTVDWGAVFTMPPSTAAEIAAVLHEDAELVARSLKHYRKNHDFGFIADDWPRGGEPRFRYKLEDVMSHLKKWYDKRQKKRQKGTV
jgi:hypothetical protein